MDQEEGLKAALADRYRIEREIGTGGMATVYLAQDLKHDRKVAVKVLKPERPRRVLRGRTAWAASFRDPAPVHPHLRDRDSGAVNPRTTVERGNLSFQ
ncbi:hypothetical protein ACFL3S_09520 [Gemmatimonadota bacterium]